MSFLTGEKEENILKTPQYFRMAFCHMWQVSSLHTDTKLTKTKKFMITYDKLQLKISFDELRHGVGVNITAQFIKKS